MHWQTLLFWLYSFLGLGLSIIYFIIQFRIRQAWEALPQVEPDYNFIPKYKYSVIVAARNEAQGIQTCLESILASDFSGKQLEVILIDDHSEDDTLNIAKAIIDERLQIISLAEGIGKKKAITKGIEIATGDWIITTDADCQFSQSVLPMMAQQAESEDYKFIAGAVQIQNASNWIGRFQEMDLLATMGVTAAGIQLQNAYLANGAHLAYPRAVFFEVNGFDGIDEFASGDDMLLLNKIAKKYPEDIHFLKNPDAIVYTKAEKNWSAFFNQRLRWASKGNAFIQSSTWWIMVAVFFNSSWICISLLLALFGSKMILPVLAFQLINKWSADALVLQSLSVFYNKRLGGLRFLSGSIFHGIYMTIIGTIAQVKKDYNWKGRTTR